MIWKPSRTNPFRGTAGRKSCSLPDEDDGISSNSNDDDEDDDDNNNNDKEDYNDDGGDGDERNFNDSGHGSNQGPRLTRTRKHPKISARLLALTYCRNLQSLPARFS